MRKPKPKVYVRNRTDSQRLANVNFKACRFMYRGLPILFKRIREVYSEEDTDILKQISQSKSSCLNSLKLLLVDNNEDSLCILKFIFEDYGVTIKTATSVDEAIEVVEKWKPDILISEIAMPDKDGYSLVRTIRNFEASSGGFLPAIALTTSVMYPEDSTEAFYAGFQEVICKPFDFSELIAVVAKLTKQPLMTD